MKPSIRDGLLVLASVGMLSLAIYGFWVMRSLDLTSVQKLNNWISSFTATLPSKPSPSGEPTTVQKIKASFPTVAAIVLFVLGSVQLVRLGRK